MDETNKLLAIGIGSIFVIGAVGLTYRAVFETANAEVDRMVFENSKAYNDGVAQEISQLQVDYLKANEEQKRAIESILRHKMANYDVKKLPDHLQAFVKEALK